MDFALDSLQSARRDGERFDALAGLAARLAATPIAAVAFLDGPALRLAGRCGIGSPSIARAGWFCDETIASPDGLLVPDAGTDAPCLEGSTRARSYAGVPFGLPDEPPAGTIFVAAPFPFPAGSDPRPALAALAAQAAGLVELRRREVEIEQLRRKLEQRTDERRRAELEVRVRARQQAAIAERGQRALAGDELAAVLQEAAELVARTLSVPSAT